MKTIYDYSYLKLQAMLLESGFKKFRSQQLFEWIYRKRVTCFASMTDLPKDMIAWLNNQFILSPIVLKQRQEASDQTVKYLFALTDGSLVEAVLMHYSYGKSLCVSSQVGCNMGCTFCASGLLKKTRNLTSGEMTAQVLFVQSELDQNQERLSHVVVMGTGEPFDNYDEVLEFLYTINHDRGLAIGARHLTVSTCGIIEGIKRLALEKIQINLAISLHAPNDKLRSQLMPINQAYPIKELMAAIEYYSQHSNRRVTYEYILLKGVNDTLEMAQQLASLIRGQNAYVNLIPYNAINEFGFQKTNIKDALKFYDYLHRLNIKCTLRQEHGSDIDAACGQLRAKHQQGVIQ